MVVVGLIWRGAVRVCGVLLGSCKFELVKNDSNVINYLYHTHIVQIFINYSITSSQVMMPIFDNIYGHIWFNNMITGCVMFHLDVLNS